MLNPGAWNWRNFAGFFWGAICFLCIIYVYFRVPETKGRSFAEMDMLFQRGVSARKFSSTKVDVFEEDIDGDLMNQYQKQSAFGGAAGHIA